MNVAYMPFTCTVLHVSLIKETSLFIALYIINYCNICIYFSNRYAPCRSTEMFSLTGHCFKLVLSGLFNRVDSVLVSDGNNGFLMGKQGCKLVESDIPLPYFSLNWWIIIKNWLFGQLWLWGNSLDFEWISKTYIDRILNFIC